MPTINLFDQKRVVNDFSTILALSGQEIYRNGQSERAVITNGSYMKSYEEKNLSTINKTSKGDLIKYDNRYWYITSQSQHRRECWKAFIRPVEYDIIFNLSSTERKPTKFLLKMPAIVSQTSDYNMRSSKTSLITTVDSEIHLFVQHNDATECIMELINYRIIFGKRAWRIAGISTVEKGFLDITCELVPSQSTDNLEVGISNCPPDWEKYIDSSIYELNDGSQRPPLPPKGSTSIEKISFVDGVLSWTEDLKKAEYGESFAGYKVTPYEKKEIWGCNEPILTAGTPFEVSEERCEVGELPVDVQTIFDDGVERVVFDKKRIE